MMTRVAYILPLVAIFAGEIDAFVSPSPRGAVKNGIFSRFGTEIFSSDRTSTGWDSFQDARPIKDISYGEESRKYRRTVYSHEDWVKHRSTDRFIYYLLAIVKSGVYKNIGREVTVATLIATFVCVYNGLVTGFTDFDGVQQAALLSAGWLPKLGLPLAPFTLASPSLGLLLVFRTNTSYQRWDEARKNWGMNINHTRDLVRMANAYYDSTGVSPAQRADDLDHVALCTWAFVRAMKRHLSPEWEDEEDFQLELYEKLPPQQAQKIIDAAHRPNRALQDLSFAIDALPMHFIRKNEIHRAVTIFEDDLGSSERLLTSPVPVFYSRHTARFVSVWLLLLPFALYDPFANTWNHIGMIPTTAILNVFLFGIEELATQLEEPFTILPMQAFCDKIYNWCMEIASWTPGDNGRPQPLPRPEHAYFASAAAPTRNGAAAPSARQQAAQPSPQFAAAQPVAAASSQPQYAAQPDAAQPPPQQQLSMYDFLKQQGQGK